MSERSSPVTLRDFFEQGSRLRARTCHAVVPTLSIVERRAWFGCAYPREIVESLPGLLEDDLAAWLVRGREALGRDWVPLEVHLQTPATDPEHYRALFRAPVYNSSSGCWLVFDAALLDASSDAGSEPQTFTSRVREQMVELMRDGNCTVEDVALALAVSTRTVQRRLESEGTTFGAVFDETRRAAAIKYLRDPQIAIKEAAYRVGFSEPSTFYRAFRRWTGATPAGYRRSLAV